MDNKHEVSLNIKIASDGQVTMKGIGNSIEELAAAFQNTLKKNANDALASIEILQKSDYKTTKK